MKKNKYSDKDDENTEWTAIDELTVRSTKTEIIAAIRFEHTIFNDYICRIENIIITLPSVRRYYIKKKIRKYRCLIEGGIISGFEASVHLKRLLYI